MSLLLVYLNMLWMQNAVSVCIAETQSLCCSPAVMYSVCKPDSSETSKSEPVYAVLFIISSEHIQRRIWKKPSTLAHCRVLFVTLRMFTRHKLDISLLFLTVNVHHKQPQQVMDFSLFLLALYLLWDNFLMSEVTSIHVNMKTPCQPQSVHTLGMLIAENVTLLQLHDFRLWTRCKWDLRCFGILHSIDW